MIVMHHPMADYIAVAAIVIPQLFMGLGAYIRMMQRLQSIEDRINYLERSLHNDRR